MENISQEEEFNDDQILERATSNDKFEMERDYNERLRQIKNLYELRLEGL